MSFLNALTKNEVLPRANIGSWPSKTQGQIYLGTLMYGIMTSFYKERAINAFVMPSPFRPDEEPDMLMTIARQIVEQAVARAFQEGILGCSLRAKAGGAFTVCPRVNWNTENIRERFDYYDMDPKRPFALNRPSTSKKQIWVDEASATRWMQVVQQEFEKPQGKGLRPMFARVLTQMIPTKPSRQRIAPKTAAIAVAIKELWRDGIPDTIPRNIVEADIIKHVKSNAGFSVDARTVQRFFKSERTKNIFT